MTGFILFIVFIILLVSGMPVAFCLLLSAICSAIYAGISLSVIFQRMFGGLDNFVLLAIPFFIFMGNIMEQGGMARRVVNFANIIIGRIRGGLAGVNVLASMFFAGISGSAVADTSSIGSMLIPMMNEEGYDKNFSAAITATSSTIGLIIPPSNAIIIYSFAVGGISVARLFAAGIIPGILVGIGLMVVGYIISVKENYPSHPTPSIKEAIKIIKETSLSLVLVLIIVGGILGGVFTATEAAVFGVVYSFIITFFIYKEIKLKDIPYIIKKTIKTSAVVLVLLATSTAFSYILSYEKIPELVCNILLNISENKIVILVIINLVLLFVGTFMDMAPAILIFTPIFLPVVKELGVDPIQFGIIMLVNLCVGLCTPPVGTVLYVAMGIADTTMDKLVKYLVYFIIPMIIILLLVTYWPIISMFIPNLLFR
jgi:tripartite ATP-independent transporter DctM subunit